IGFAIFRERADRTLQDPGDPSFYLKLPELGVIPAKGLDGPRQPGKQGGRSLTVHGNGNGNGSSNGHGSNGHGSALDPEVLDDSLELISFNRKSSLLAESFRTILTSILF